MKLKEKLAEENVQEQDFISNENRRAYGEGFLVGFEKAKTLAVESLKQSLKDYTGYCFSVGRDMTVNDLASLGEEEV